MIILVIMSPVEGERVRYHLRRRSKCLVSLECFRVVQRVLTHPRWLIIWTFLSRSERSVGPIYYLPWAYSRLALVYRRVIVKRWCPLLLHRILSQFRKFSFSSLQRALGTGHPLMSAISCTQYPGRSRSRWFRSYRLYFTASVRMCSSIRIP